MFFKKARRPTRRHRPRSVTTQKSKTKSRGWLKWLVKDIASMKAADATREDAKTTVTRIIEGLVELRKKADDIRRNYE